MKKRRGMMAEKKPNREKTIDAAGGLLFREKDDQVEILLIFRNNVWDLPKGKKEADESYEECALREVSEETGLNDLQLKGHLTDTYHEYEENGVGVGKTTRWYSMIATDPLADMQPQKEEGIMEVLWTPLNRAKELVGYKNLLDVIEAFDFKHKKKRDP
jgi:8-oxo-dGTP pyrophosphatase MutT (NUDIX family)